MKKNKRGNKTRNVIHQNYVDEGNQAARSNLIRMKRELFMLDITQTQLIQSNFVFSTKKINPLRFCRREIVTFSRYCLAIYGEHARIYGIMFLRCGRKTVTSGSWIHLIVEVC